MPYDITLYANWVAIQYSGVVDAADVIASVKTDEFMNGLESLHKVIFDYSNASEVNFSHENIAEFAVLGRILGSINDNVHAVCIPSLSNKRTDRARLYQEQASTDSWHVHIVESREEAEALMRKL
ncbi:hypothetical protein OE749_07955 [Aestuariibacter sp. AA17]|uniref:Uncharacterized protein n=1 Tax=Fluctibacter corallii TaxID=2984329 RepID=A0ABT3A8I1_9ALTE|nr:hypothetical protein [Aestuariibacter sp. AA17]MCV2884626.1 hypothetical protein [Aestuariibacter sp. AA17]